MTDLTREQLETLLDGATQGPWQADGEPWNRIVWSSAENRVCFMAHSNGLDDARDIATSNLVAAAPDLARQLLATMTALAEAQAAQAGVVERCAGSVKAHSETARKKLRETYDVGDADGNALWNCIVTHLDIAEEAIRSIADPTGVKLLAGLRAERDALKKKLISPDPYEDTAHPDDHAVNKFAAVMKGKLAAKRLQGRGGWLQHGRDRRCDRQANCRPLPHQKRQNQWLKIKSAAASGKTSPSLSHGQKPLASRSA